MTLVALDELYDLGIAIKNYFLFEPLTPSAQNGNY
jgi:hypothetical protein